MFLKESGSNGARALCSFLPLKILKPSFENAHFPGGVVVIDPNRVALMTAHTAEQSPPASTLVSKIPRPDASVTPRSSLSSNKKYSKQTSPDGSYFNPSGKAVQEFQIPTPEGNDKLDVNLHCLNICENAKEKTKDPKWLPVHPRNLPNK